MKRVKELFVEAFESKMLEHGFGRKGIIYHRLVNNKIFQLLSCKSYDCGYEFEIQFSIIPVCLGGKCSDYYDVDSLVVFNEFPWYYDDVYGFEKHFSEALRCTEKYLFPLFDSIFDYQSFLSNLPTKSMISRVGYVKEVEIVDLLLNRYDECQKTKEELIRNWFDRNATHIAERLEKYKIYCHPVHKRMFDALCSYFYDMKAAILADDKEAIEARIMARENELLSSYARTFGKKE